jgi:transposase
VKPRDKLSQYWQVIQGNLFPWLAEELGPLTEKQQQLITVLELTRLEEFIPDRSYSVGRPTDDRSAIARAFVAKAVYNINTTTHLLDRLKSDKALRRICGWEKMAEIPSESTFSRAFSEFSESELTQSVHQALIEKYQSERLIGHISRDSTAIEAREKVVRQEKEPRLAQYKRGRPKKDEVRPPAEPTRLERQRNMPLEEMLAELPKTCDIGTKRNSQGHQESWKGYKLHLDTADGGVPISAILTSASLHDSQAAIPLATLTALRVVNLYDLMDAAYDAEVIRTHSQSLQHIPLIDFNHRHESDTRIFAPHEAQRYKERSTAERANSRLKDEFGALMVHVRGHAKVMTHLMFGVIALTVDQLMRWVT